MSYGWTGPGALTDPSLPHAGSVGAVDLDEVLRVLDALEGRRVRCWVAGGWGVAALAGAQTRPHRDLDLAVHADDLGPALDALADLGYRRETDWLPVRVEYAAHGRGWVDVHPVAFDAAGHGRQAGLDGAHFDYPPDALTTGTVSGRAVPCLSVAQQRAFHAGYPLRDQDRHDLAVLDGIDALDAVDGLGALDRLGPPGASATVGGMTDDVRNVLTALDAVAEPWQPHRLTSVNDYDVKVVKLDGEFVWHSHPETDELFLVVSGALTIQLRDRDVHLGQMDTFVVPRGVEHCPRADGEVAAILIEPRGTVNTGDAGGERTAELREL